MSVPSMCPVLGTIYINLPVHTCFVDHRAQSETVRKIITQVRTQEFSYKERPPKKINWTQYDRAQIHEIADTLEFIRVLVDTAARRIASRHQESDKKPGRPATGAIDVTKVLLLQSYFGVANRVAEGLLELFWEKLGLQESFSYKTIERGYDRETVNEILNEALRLTNAPVKGLEKVFSIDGSGSPTRMRQSYSADREQQRKKGDGTECSDKFAQGMHDYVYSIITVGARYKLITSYQNTTNHSIGELAFFEDSMNETKGLHPDMEMVTGDGLFATRPCCRIVNQLGAIPRFLPRRNVTRQRKGVKAWMDMLDDLVDNPQGWLRDYYQREASESVNSVIKRLNQWPLRKRLNPRKRTEDRLRGLCYNIRQLCYLVYLADLVVLPVIDAAG